MKRILLIVLISSLFIFCAASESVEEIVITGIGTSVDDAIENGLKHAVKQAVGSILRSEMTFSSTSLVYNDEMTLEEAYYDNLQTYSKGFVENYEVIAMSMEEELWTVELRVVVSYEPLKDYIINIDPAQLEIDGEKIGRMIEANQQTNDDFKGLIEQIIREMDFIKKASEVKKLDFKVDSYSQDDVELSVKAELFQRDDYLEFIMNNFEDCFSSIEHQLVKNEIETKKSLSGVVIYLSQIEPLEGLSPTVHILSSKTDNRLVFDSYYLKQEDPNSAIFDELLSEFLERQYCTISVRFLDTDNHQLLESEGQMVSEKGVFLKSQAMGVAYTKQHGGHYFFCPAVLNMQSGSLKFNFEPLRFSWKIKMNTEDFLRLKNLEITIK